VVEPSPNDLLQMQLHMANLIKLAKIVKEEELLVEVGKL
jgi:hypothetical protein